MARSQSKLDKTDLAIIRILQKDGRRPYAEIAAELGLAASTVQQRATRLIETGLVQITAVTDPATIGYAVAATIAVKVEGTRLLEAAAAIEKFKEVGYVALCTGSYDILLEVGCRDNDELLNFISSKLAKVKGVRETETFLYLRIVKNTYQWGLLEE
ncbi:MAG: Lrp/AsnC family transcriptional regulator [Chloroflexi bacterium]|nr:Lrp/AsnC family transcriptional regulator [Chloroflexota bacterium]